MASIIKSNTYADFNGREILTANNDGALTTQKTLHPAFSATVSTTQSVSNASWTRIDFDDVLFNYGNCYSTSDYKFTPNLAGYYIFSMQISFAADIQYAGLYKNGSNIADAPMVGDIGDNQTSHSSQTYIAYANGSSDYFEGYAYHERGSSTTTTDTRDRFRFMAYRIGS